MRICAIDAPNRIVWRTSSVGMARIGQPHATRRSAMPRVSAGAAKIAKILGDLCYVEIQASVYA